MFMSACSINIFPISLIINHSKEKGNVRKPDTELSIIFHINRIIEIKYRCNEKMMQMVKEKLDFVQTLIIMISIISTMNIN